MIFVGAGSLLWRAVKFALDNNHQVDLVCVPENEKIPPTINSINIHHTADVNRDIEIIISASRDNIIWSINNKTIFRSELITHFTIYNIHNGPLPQYRGIPEVAISFALLAAESHYGATLHRVDTGIDTGEILDLEYFPINPGDKFQDVMLGGVRACHTLLERNLTAAAQNTLSPIEPRDLKAAPDYYGYHRMLELAAYREHPIFSPAPALGIFTPLYPELADLLTHSDM